MKYLSKKEGFTIVETLVAVAILAIGITAPITVIFSAIQTTRISEDRILAYYFAQEGIEMIRYVRDTNIISGDDWLDNLIQCTNGNQCQIDDPLDLVSDPGNMFRNCVGSNCGIIKYNGTLFGYDGATDTKFKRRIIINNVAGTNVEKEIVVTVDWTTNSKDYSYVLSERIFNWSGL